MNSILSGSFMTILGLGIIPAADPLGFPVPPWILQVLAYFTLTLHLMAMNFTIGGSLIILWTFIRKNPDNTNIRRFFGAGLPLGVSYIVTLGIPPLLFVQVLYGQLFYSSSVLLGAFWIIIIPVLLLAYTGYYYHKFQSESKPHYQWLVILISTILLIYIGYMLVSNLTLSMTPEKWQSLYKAYPGGGNIHHGEPTLHSRLLLFLSGAFAAAGVALIWRGTYLSKWLKSDEGKKSQSKGFKILLISIPVWIIAAVGVYMTRPEDISNLWAMDTVKVLFAIGVASAIITTLFGYLSIGRRSAVFPLLSSLGVFGAVLSMVIFRDMARIYALSSSFTLELVPVNAQWGMFMLFMATLVIGLLFLIVLFAKVFPAMTAGWRRANGAGISAG